MIKPCVVYKRAHYHTLNAVVATTSRAESLHKALNNQFCNVPMPMADHLTYFIARRHEHIPLHCLVRLGARALCCRATVHNRWQCM
jgi:hypothetical protein